MGEVRVSNADTNQASRVNGILEALFIILAAGVGLLAGMFGWVAVWPFVAALVGFLVLRYLLRVPFHQAFAIYLAVAALNYYYFYCAQLTGRNPTDVGEWGRPATSLEKAQKDIVFLGLLVLASFQLIRYRLENRGLWGKQLTHPIALLLIGFMGFTWIRALFWVFQGDSWFDVLYYLRSNVEFAVIPLLMVTALIQRPSHLTGLCKGLVALLPVVAVLGIVEFLIHGSPFQRTFGGDTVYYRAVATLQNPNNLGGYLATTIGMTVALLLAPEQNRSRWEIFWLGLGLPLGLIALLMTLSRSSILFFGVSISAWLLVRLWKAKKSQTINASHKLTSDAQTILSPVVWLGGMGLVVLVLMLMPFFNLEQGMGSAFSQYLNPNSLMAGYRTYAPLITLDHILANPLTALFGYSKAIMPDKSDNALAVLLLRNGLVGFSLYMGIWLGCLGISLRRMLTPGVYPGISVVYGICFYVLLFQLLYGFSAAINSNFPHNLYFWVMVGMVLWLESPSVTLDSNQ